MSEFIVMVKITAINEADAEKARSELVAGLEDARDSGELGEGLSFNAGEVTLIESPHHEVLIEAAREIHAHCSDDNIEVDDNATISEGCDGTWVQGWLFVDKGELKARGIESSQAVYDEEGGEDE